MIPVCVALGSNVDAERHVRMAVTLLREHFGQLRLSPVYRNPAVGFAGADFLNLVAGFDTALPLTELIPTLSDIEARCGRERGAQRFAPRSMDMDLLLYGDTVSETPLKLPRPDILRYPFVLKPLADLMGEARHPVTGRRYAEHWEEMAEAGGGLRPVTLAGL